MEDGRFVSFFCKNDLIEKIKAQSKNEERSVSGHIRAALNNYDVGDWWSNKQKVKKK